MLLGNETMFSSSLAPNLQRQTVAAGRRHYAIALAGYQRALSLLREAQNEGVILSPRLAEKVLSQAAWGLQPLVLGKKSIQITIHDEKAAIKLFPDDSLPYQFLACIYHTKAILIPYGKRGVVDHSTNRIVKWVKLHPTPAQRKLRLHYLRQSGRYAEIAVRLTPKDPVANYLLWEDLVALKIKAKNRDFYMAVAIAARKNIRPIYFHYSSFRIKNLEDMLENYGRWERNPAYKQMQKGEWPNQWPPLPTISTTKKSQKDDIQK